MTHPQATPGDPAPQPVSEWLEVRATSAGVDPESRLLLSYRVTNRGPVPVLLADVVPAERDEQGLLTVDPLDAQVSFAPGPVVVVERGVPERGRDVHVEVPWCPLARRVDPGSSVTGMVGLPLPARPQTPYRRPVGAPVGPVTQVPTVRLTLGWLPAQGHSPELLRAVATTQGPLVYVGVAPGVLTRSSTDLDVVVPALLPVPARSWVCARCGAQNLGQHDRCPRCGEPAPPAAGPAGGAPGVAAGGWRATHVVGPRGAAWYAGAAATPGGTLDPGLPLAVVGRTGDWAHVAAQNGWTGWVDARLLVPV